MANANSMGDLCISFDTECRNSLSLKGLKRVLENELIYDINKTSVDYYEKAKQEYFKVIVKNITGEKIVLSEDGENLSLKYNEEWIVGVDTNDESEEITINVINRKKNVFFSESKVLNGNGDRLMIRGGGWGKQNGQLYKDVNTTPLNAPENTIGGFYVINEPTKIVGMYGASYTLEQAEKFIYVEFKLSYKDEEEGVYKTDKLYIIIKGEHKGEFYFTLEEAKEAAGDIFVPEVVETARSSNSSTYYITFNGPVTNTSMRDGKFIVNGTDYEINGWGVSEDSNKISIGSYSFWQAYDNEQNVEVSIHLPTLKVNGVEFEDFTVTI